MIVQRVAVRELTKALGRNVTIRTIHFNPYALSITVHGFVIDEPKGETFLSWETFYANFEPWSSLFHRTWIFKEGILLEPHANVIRNADGTLNFADLLLLPWPKIPSFRLSFMSIDNGKVIFHDKALQSSFSTTIGPLTANFKNFSINPDHKNQYSISATSETGENFSWNGFFRLNPLSSHGEIMAKDIQIKKYYPYFEEFLDFRIKEGKLTARAIYDLDLSLNHFKAILSDGALSAHSLKVYEHESNAPFFGLAKLALTGVHVDLIQQEIKIASIKIDDGSAILRRLSNQSFNIEHLIKPVSNPLTTKKLPSSNWSISVGEIRLANFTVKVMHSLCREMISWKEIRLFKPTFQINPLVASVGAITLNDGRLAFSDHSVTSPVKMTLNHLNVQIGGFSSKIPQPASTTPLSINMRR